MISCLCMIFVIARSQNTSDDLSETIKTVKHLFAKKKTAKKDSAATSANTIPSGKPGKRQVEGIFTREIYRPKQKLLTAMKCGHLTWAQL